MPGSQVAHVLFSLPPAPLAYSTVPEDTDTGCASWSPLHPALSRPPPAGKHSLSGGGECPQLPLTSLGFPGADSPVGTGWG